MKQADDGSGQRVNAGEIWSFLAIAIVAGEREVACKGFTAVLLGDDVINLEGQMAVGLAKLAVFAGTVCSPPDQA
jgi:hypothetical protein